MVSIGIVVLEKKIKNTYHSFCHFWASCFFSILLINKYIFLEEHPIDIHSKFIPIGPMVSEMVMGGDDATDDEMIKMDTK